MIWDPSKSPTSLRPSTAIWGPWPPETIAPFWDLNPPETLIPLPRPQPLLDPIALLNPLTSSQTLAPF